MVENNGNGKLVHIPLTVFLAAIIAMGGYIAKMQTDLVGLQGRTVTILERMDNRNQLEFNRVHSEHSRNQIDCKELRENQIKMLQTLGVQIPRPGG
jgi:hypothetical protein